MNVFVMKCNYRENLRTKRGDLGYMTTASWNGKKEIGQRKQGFFATIRKRVTNFEFRVGCGYDAKTRVVNENDATVH